MPDLKLRVFDKDGYIIHDSLPSGIDKEGQEIVRYSSQS